MEARRFRVALCATICCSVLSAYCEAGSARSSNFIVHAPTQEFAEKVCKEAEVLRARLAREWLGRELPRWADPVPIQVFFRSGAGGVTSFEFHGRVPRRWTMEIQGSKERILDSVLPHEITHTIFATHYGQQLPRWADEGACTTVEHISERKKQDRILIYFLTNDKGIPFNKMFRMMEYPREMLSIYAQGYSVCRFLIAQGGKRKFVKFIKSGLDSRDWDGAVEKHYGFKNLSELQLTWNDWVAQGSPRLPDGVQLVSAESTMEPAAESDRETTVESNTASSGDGRQGVPPNTFDSQSAVAAAPLASTQPRRPVMRTSQPQAPLRGKLVPIGEAERQPARSNSDGLALNEPNNGLPARLAVSSPTPKQTAGQGGWYARVRDSGRAGYRPGSIGRMLR